MVYTRAQLTPVIDFDEASRLWKANKISLGNGTYKYKNNCQHITKNGAPCKKKCKEGDDVCHIHQDNK
jgi:hypothetical protein